LITVCGTTPRKGRRSFSEEEAAALVGQDRSLGNLGRVDDADVVSLELAGEFGLQR
jgi:hypothetical protein